MLKPVVALLLISSLIGCSSLTPRDLRGNTPDAVHSSVKQPKQVALCIADIWENTNLFGGSVGVNMRETATGYTVSMSYSGNLHYLVDISKTSTGSVTKLFTGKIISFGENKSVSEVTNCQL